MNEREKILAVGFIRSNNKMIITSIEFWEYLNERRLETNRYRAVELLKELNQNQIGRNLWMLDTDRIHQYTMEVPQRKQRRNGQSWEGSRRTSMKRPVRNAGKSGNC